MALISRLAVIDENIWHFASEDAQHRYEIENENKRHAFCIGRLYFKLGVYVHWRPEQEEPPTAIAYETA